MALMKTAEDGLRATGEPEKETHQAAWFRMLTRPVGHLLGTISVTVWVIVCAAFAHLHPEWQPPLVVVGATPFIIWTSVLSWRFERQRAESRDTLE